MSTEVAKGLKRDEDIIVGYPLRYPKSVKKQIVKLFARKSLESGETISFNDSLIYLINKGIEAENQIK